MKQTIKAWWIVGKDNWPWNLQIYLKKMYANEAYENVCKGKFRNEFLEMGNKIVPCTISYFLPSKNIKS